MEHCADYVLCDPLPLYYDIQGQGEMFRKKHIEQSPCVEIVHINEKNKKGLTNKKCVVKYNYSNRKVQRNDALVLPVLLSSSRYVLNRVSLVSDSRNNSGGATDRAQ